MDALIRFAFDSEQREVTHGLKENSDRADILTERPIVFEYEGKDDTNSVIGDISCYECPEHNFFDIADFCKEKGRHENK